MKGKRIIIIGAGLLQVPAIQIAQEMGLYTIVFDYNKDAPGNTNSSGNGTLYNSF